jgi:cell division protein FtsB
MAYFRLVLSTRVWYFPLAMHPPLAAEPLAPDWPHRRRANPWVRRLLVFVTCALLLDALIGEKGLAETIRARRDRQLAAAGVQTMKRENTALQHQVELLLGDPATIEAIARRDLGLIRQGEILIIVTDPK